MNVAETSIWGVTPAQLHERFWASRGVQIVRQGRPAPISDSAELFLLADQRLLTLFDLSATLDVLCWTQPRLLFRRRPLGASDFRYPRR